MHEHAPLQVDHGVALSQGRCAFINAHAGNAFSIVGRPQNFAGAPARVAIGGVEVVHDLALVPYVIAGGQHVATKIEDFVGDGRRQPETACGIFHVGDHQINLVGLHHMGEMVTYDLAPRAAEDVTDEEYLHAVCDINIFD